MAASKMASKSRGNLREHVQKQLRTSSSVGEGKSGNVYKVTGFNGEQFALKVSGYLDATKKEEKYLKREVETLSRFDHPHIVKYIDGWDIRDSQGQLRVYILTEYCSGGDLRSYLNNTLGRPPPEALFGAWLAQIASGLEFIHSMGVLHRNVKTPNIMVDHVTLKIGDFGMSKMLLQPDAMAKSQVGTPYFMSPEILNGRQYNAKTDIWSFGCTAYEMATLTTIFDAKTITTLLSGINKHKATQVTKQLQYSIFFQTLIGDMLQQDPSARPDAGEILSRLLREGYKTTHQDMTASATLTSTMSSTRSSTRTYQGQGQTDSKAVLWSGMDSDTSGIVSDASSMVIHDVSNPPWRDIDKGGKAPSARVAVIPPSPGGRSRTKSEGGVPDMDLGLLKFSQLQREKKHSQSKLHKSVTFDQGVLTSKIPEQEVTKGKGEEEAEELMTSEDKGKMLRQIEEVQRSLAQTLGDGVFTAAFSTLNIRTDTKMEKELASVLGDKYDEFGPRFVVLRALEREFTAQRDDRHDMKRKPLNKTI